MAINEIQRQAYLKAMGITPYFPRFTLPGAALSPLCEWPGEMPGVAQADAIADGAEVPVAEKATVFEIERFETGHSEIRHSETGQTVGEATNPGKKPAIDLQFEAPPRQRAEPVTPPPVVADTGVEQVQFKAALIPLAGGFAVLDQLPVMSNGQLPPSHFRLLCNLLRACGLPDPSEQTLTRSFQWPLPLELGDADNGAAAARSSLQAFIEQLCQEQEVKYLLFMGPALARQLYGDAGELGQGLQQFAGENWQTLVTESLGQVLKVGTLKRSLWQSLRNLPPDVH